MSIKSKINSVTSLIEQYGMHDLFLRYQEHFLTKKLDQTYQADHSKYFPTESELDKQRKHTFSFQPLYSIVVPAYETPVTFLKELIDSVLIQTYSNFELILADGSTSSIVKDTVNSYSDTRIRYIKLSKNAGISENTNEGLTYAKGDYIALLDHDDVLTPNALYEMTLELNQSEILPDMVYSDEDKLIANTGVLTSPSFKPDFNPEYFRHVNYICHFLIFSHQLLDQVGGLDSTYDGAQDFEFILRCHAFGAKIHHIPKILYHWRIHPNSTASNPNSKLYAFTNGAKAIEDYLSKIKEPGTATISKDLGFYHVSYQLPTSCTICIQVHTQKQLNAFQKRTRELSGIDITYLLKEDRASFLSEAAADYLVFTSPDALPVSKNWLSSLLGICQWNRVGIVGAKCISRSNKNLNCGFTYDTEGNLYPLSAGLPSGYHGYLHRADSNQNVSGISLSLAMMKASTAKEIQDFCFDLPSPYCDMELCFKLSSLGLQIILDADTLVKIASTSVPEEGKSLFAKRNATLLQHTDPYYNINFQCTNSSFQL